jgi:hypothetical protein
VFQIIADGAARNYKLVRQHFAQHVPPFIAGATQALRIACSTTDNCLATAKPKAGKLLAGIHLRIDVRVSHDKLTQVVLPKAINRIGSIAYACMLTSS